MKKIADGNAFRYLSPEPGPTEMGIPADASATVHLRTASEIESERLAMKALEKFDLTKPWPRKS